MEKILISTVTPVYSGDAFLRELIDSLNELRSDWEQGDDHLHLCEAIFVCDEPSDGSETILRALEKEHSWVKVLTLSKNFGQHPATIAGFLHSVGDWIITLDEDLQHRPEWIPNLLYTVASEGCDLVYAKPAKGVNHSLFRDAGSNLYKSMLGKLTGNPHVKNFSSFRLVRGNIARAAASLCGQGVYLDIALCWFTDRVACIPLPLRDLRYQDTSESGYSFRKLLAHARGLLHTGQTTILRTVSMFGFAVMAVSGVYGIYVLLNRLLDPASVPVRGWTSLFLSILFFGGLICFLIGVIMEYMSNTILQLQGKPTYYVIDRSKDALLSNIKPHTV